MFSNRLLTFLFSLLAFPMACAHAQTGPVEPPANTVYNIVFVGDSITNGVGVANAATQAAPVICGQELQKLVPGSVVYVLNQGYPGYTSLALLSQMNPIEGYAVPPFVKAHPGQLIFSIMAGTNDSANSGVVGCAASPDVYRKNMKGIVDDILLHHPDAEIFLHHPTWYSFNTHNGADYERAAPARLKSYFPVIDALVTDYAASHPNHVFLGDTKAYDYFAANYKTELAPEQGTDGPFYLHPNATGAASLGKFWAEAMAPNLVK